MSLGLTGAKPLGRKRNPPEDRRNDRTVRFDAELAELGYAIARFRGITFAEYLSELARPIIEADGKEMINRWNEKLTKSDPESKGQND